MEQLQDIFGNKIEVLENYKKYLSSNLDITKDGILNKIIRDTRLNVKLVIFHFIIC